MQYRKTMNWTQGRKQIRKTEVGTLFESLVLVCLKVPLHPCPFLNYSPSPGILQSDQLPLLLESIYIWVLSIETKCNMYNIGIRKNDLRVQKKLHNILLGREASCKKKTLYVKVQYFSDYKTHHFPPNLGGKWGCVLQSECSLPGSL